MMRVMPVSMLFQYTSNNISLWGFIKVKLGIDRLLENSALRKKLKNRKIALLGHPASITSAGIHSLDAIMQAGGLKITSVFGPQHGLRGDVQDNMIETHDYIDPKYKIPVYSLYGKVRRPTDEMLESFDVILIDLQNVGTRIYTFLTTLLYMLEASAASGKTVWVLDRPNPAGRPIEGSLLEKGQESFVGSSTFPMRHGLTLGEAARWFIDNHKIDVDCEVIEMKGYDPTKAPFFGWAKDLPWVNPSPNISSLNSTRCFPGTVLLEGTTLSEGRGTTVSLEVIGAPDLDPEKILQKMQTLAPNWMKGCMIRPCSFEPTFHKHQGKLCHGVQIHTDHPKYNHSTFRPYRFVALWLKALRLIAPGYPIWRDFEYEYEKNRMPIDVINGGPKLRNWVDTPDATVGDFDKMLKTDEKYWAKTRKKFLIYPS